MGLFDMMSPIDKAKMTGIKDPQIAKWFLNHQQQNAQLNPSIPAPAAPVKGPNFAQRASDFLMPGPQGLPEGLLTDEDISSAQKQGWLGLGASLLADSGPKTADQYATTGQAIGRGIQAMQGGYKGAVDSAMNMRAGAQQMQAQQQEMEANKIALEKAKQLPALRDAIIKKNPMPDTNDREAMLKWMDKVIPQFIEISDDETVTRLGTIYQAAASSLRQQQKEPGQFMEVPGPDGKPRTVYVKESDIPTGGVPTYERPREITPYQQMMMGQREFTNEQSLYSDFQMDTKKAATATFILNDTLREADRAINGEVASQTRMLYGFINSMDDTAVREGEQRLVQNAASLVAQAEAAISKLNTDKTYSVPKPLLEQMKGLMERRMGGNKSYLKSQEQKYQSVAKRHKLDPSRFSVVIPDFTQENMMPGVSGGSTSTAAPAAPALRKPNESWQDYLKRTAGGQ